MINLVRFDVDCCRLQHFKINAKYKLSPTPPAEVKTGKLSQHQVYKLLCKQLERKKQLTQLLLFILALGLIISCSHLTSACRPVYFGPDFNGDQKVACRCNESYCDSPLNFSWPKDGASVFRLTSNLRGARFEQSRLKLQDLLRRQEQPQDELEDDFIISLDINKRFQQVVGYGGAFTDSASMLMLDKLTPASRAHLLIDYFSPLGLDYNLARVPIGGTDMSWRPYSYNDLPAGEEDFNLNKFKLQDEDVSYKLPLIKQVNKLRGKFNLGPLKLLASSWSAPNWMKSNRDLVQGRLKDDDDDMQASTNNLNNNDDDYGDNDDNENLNNNLSSSGTTNIKGKYYDAYARYICKFIDQYEMKLGEPESPESPKSPKSPKLLPDEKRFKNNSTPSINHIWALTPQNEPCTPGRLGYTVVNYNSVNFDPKQMAQFISGHLVPNLLNANRSARELALFIWDDTLLGFDNYKDHLFGANQIIQSGKQEINEYIRGLALHWYSQGLDKLPYSVLYDLRRWLPPRFSMISTEASFIGRPIVGDWTRGEKYARDIIENLRSGSIGWIDWNLVLNMNGGPTWSKNYLDSAILVDELTGSYLKNPMFYAIGHLTRFIKPQSYIIDSQVRVRQINTTQNATNARNTRNAQGRPIWRLVDEAAEQTSQLLVVASELYYDGTRHHHHQQQQQQPGPMRRQIALVLLNRAARNLQVSLELAHCGSPLGRTKWPLSLSLEAKSFTSLAFNC